MPVVEEVSRRFARLGCRTDAIEDEVTTALTQQDIQPEPQSTDEEEVEEEV